MDIKDKMGGGEKGSDERKRTRDEDFGSSQDLKQDMYKEKDRGFE